jgi:hypothetical protein
MKKIVFILSAFAFASAMSCNNSGEKNDPSSGINNSQAKPSVTFDGDLVDSLEKEVMAAHNIAMPKSMKIPGLQKETNRLIDSINKLPPKMQAAAAPYKAKLDGLLKDLSYADSAMNNWMDNYVFDSGKDTIEQRIKYLTVEKIKIENAKEAILGSLKKADSLLKH